MTKRPNQLAICLGLFRYTLAATMRNRLSFAFGLLFPLVLLVGFGMFSDGVNKSDIGIATPLAKTDSPFIQALEDLSKSPTGPINVVVLPEDELVRRVSRGAVGAGLEPGKSAGELTIVTSTANPIAGGSASGIIRSIAGQFNLKAAERLAGANFKAPVTLASRDVAGKTFRYIDFALPGIVGFSLIFSATFGIAFPFLALRRTLVLKRMQATCAKPISFVVSQCLARTVQSLGQAVVLIGVGVLVYHFFLPSGLLTFLEMTIVAGLGIASFMGFGILIANTTRDEHVAPLVINIFNLPQVVFAGVFFPTDKLPGWVQVLADKLPLSYVNTAMRSIASDGKHLTDVWPQILGMLVWCAVSYIAAAWTFKLE